MQYTVQQETFEGENVCRFQDFIAIHESFLYEIFGLVSFSGTSEQSAKVFFTKLYFPLIYKVFFLENFSHFNQS